ncbi:hypothetical protein M9Y10_029193 [Tritrichomonas musculus]|uniref:Kinase n=1 Tax=Tritrichomonas musculus TaxID=1915356 RepID=A0ABR2KLL7_9EUKA
MLTYSNSESNNANNINASKDINRSSKPMIHLTLHRDKRAGLNLRNRVFGHSDSIISFREGYIAKILGEGESKFYSKYKKQLHKCLPKEFVPEILGACFITCDNQNKGSDDFQIMYKNSVKIPKMSNSPVYLLQKDIVAGYEKPAILDLKIGIRTWKFGDPQEVGQRRSKKMMAGSCAQTNFRVRAAMWYNAHFNTENDHLYNYDNNGITFVTRKFGNSCSMNQLMNFFKDFFKYRNNISLFIEKVKTLKESLMILRDTFGMRLYSSSILVVYDDKNPDKLDLRILDFEKSYFNIEKVAAQYDEPLSQCEDRIIEALENFQNLLQSI